MEEFVEQMTQGPSREWHANGGADARVSCIFGEGPLEASVLGRG
jgi:hypothetical protein